MFRWKNLGTMKQTVTTDDMFAKICSLLSGAQKFKKACLCYSKLKTTICGSESGHLCWPVCMLLEPTMCIGASVINQKARKMVTWSNESHGLLHYMHGWVCILFRDTRKLWMSGLQPCPQELNILDLKCPFMESVFSDDCELFQEVDAPWHKGEEICFDSKMAAIFFIKYLCKLGLLKRSSYPSAQRLSSFQYIYRVSLKCWMASKSYWKLLPQMHVPHKYGI